MFSPLRALTDPDIGLRLHRPATGWALAIILGITLGVLHGHGAAWLTVGTGAVVLSWFLWRVVRPTLLCLAALAFAAWYGALTHSANTLSEERLTVARLSGEPIALEATVANNCFTIPRKKAAPYGSFALEEATFADGEKLSGWKLHGFYYDADGPLPKMGERWLFYARIRSSVWYNNLQCTLYGAPDPATLPQKVDPPTGETPPLEGDKLLAHLTEMGACEEPLFLTVTFEKEPEIVSRKRGGNYVRATFSQAWLEDGTPIAHPKMTLYLYDSSEHFPRAGETWRLPVTLRKRFSAKALAFSCKVDRIPIPPSRHLVAKDAHDKLRYRFAHLRNRLAEHLALGVHPDEALLTQTMTLGVRKRLPREEMQRYADAGIIHIFSISGLHVGILAGILFWFLAWVGLRLRTRVLVVLPTLLGYLLLTGIPPSAARACCMAILYCAAPFFMRKADAPSALLITAVGALIYEPNWVSNVGALLSFTVMGGILLYMSPIAYFVNLLFHSRLRRTAIGEVRLEMPWHFRARRALATLIGMTLAAWAVSVPLTLYFFGRFSVIGTLLNLFIPFLTLFIVWFACASALSGFFLPALSILLNRANALILDLIERICDLSLLTPWAVYETLSRPPLTLILLAEGLLLWGGLYLRALEKHVRLRDPQDPNAYDLLLRRVQ